MPTRLNLSLRVTEIWDWQRNASCLGCESSMFFHPDRERGRAPECGTSAPR